MKLKDIKWLRHMPRNTIIYIDGKPWTYTLQKDQDGQWTINFIPLESSKGSK